MAAGTSPATSPKGRGGRVSSFPVRLPLYRTNGPAGGIGRRSRFRSCRREAWGFESLAGHHRHDQHRTGRFERSGEPRRRRVSCPARRDRTGSAEAEPRTGCGAPARAAREGRPSARPSTDAASAPAGRPAAPPAAPLRAASPGRAQGQARSRRPRVAPAASLPADRRAPPRPARERPAKKRAAERAAVERAVRPLASPNLSWRHRRGPQAWRAAPPPAAAPSGRPPEPARPRAAPQGEPRPASRACKTT